MKKKKIIMKNRFVLSCLVAAMSVPMVAQTYNPMRPNNTAWGRNSIVTGYYYEEQRVFNSNVNLYSTQETFVQDFRSTSSYVSGVVNGEDGGGGQFYTAASSIQSGLTTQAYAAKRLGGPGGGGIAPPTTAPLPFGWDVWLLLVAAGVVYVWRKRPIPGPSLKGKGDDSK